MTTAFFAVHELHRLLWREGAAGIAQHGHKQHAARDQGDENQVPVVDDELHKSFLSGSGSARF
jgi:hypothetical protein